MTPHLRACAAWSSAIHWVVDPVHRLDSFHTEKLIQLAVQAAELILQIIKLCIDASHLSLELGAPPVIALSAVPAASAGSKLPGEVFTRFRCEIFNSIQFSSGVRLGAPPAFRVGLSEIAGHVVEHPSQSNLWHLPIT